MKYTRLAAFVAAAALALSACGSAGSDDESSADYDVVEDAADDFPDGSPMQEFAEAGKIKVGVKFDQPGLGFKKAGADEPVGLDIEIAKYMAAKLGIEPSDIEWVETTSQNREPFLQKGTVDFVLASYSITDERQEVVGQSGPYYVTGQQILTKKDSDIDDVSDIKDMEVCSVTGSTSLKQVEEKGAKPRGFETYSECRDQVLDGSVDAMTTDGAILLGYAAENPDELEVVGEPFSEEPYGIGFDKDKPELCQFIADTIEDAEEDGSWEKAFEATLGKSGVDTPEPPELESCS